MTMFRRKLKAKIKPGKKVITDRGFKPKGTDEREIAMVALPRVGHGSKEFRNFKSRARYRHETFKSMDDTFRHGEEKHKLAFQAVCVTVQYQKEHGAKVFVV